MPSSAPSPKRPSISVVVPTFREVESLPHLLDRLSTVRDTQGLDLDVWIMDDDSNDGTEALIEARGEDWVSLVVRKEDHGLSPAVLDGFRRARGDVLVCMDADLSHPPEKISELVDGLAQGFDFMVGSRYVPGGTTSDDWGFLRWVNSRVATLLARPFTSITDPMSGFFCLKRSSFEASDELSPVGYKVGLELIVKCRARRVGEVAIHFEDRVYGESKLTLAQQLLYLRHLRRLGIYKFGVWSHLAQFLVVGALGTVVNLAVLTALLLLAVPQEPAIAAAIFISMCFNFVLNRRFSFSYARSGPWFPQFLGFAAASSVGAGVNFLATTSLLDVRPDLPVQAAALVGIVAGTAVNFVANRFLVFRAKHVRPKSDDSSTNE